MKNFKTVRPVILVSAIYCMLCVFLSCSFFSSFSESESESGIQISGLSMPKTVISVSVGEMAYISVNIKPLDVQKDVKLSWAYDSNIITADTSSSWGATITGVKEGQTSVKCSYGGYEATCIVTVKGYAETYEKTVEPYIYSNTSILQMSPGVTEKVSVSLYGGDVSDINNYSWTLDDPSICSIQPTGQYCVIKANSTGYTRIKVTNPKSSIPYYIGVYVFDDFSKTTYITTSDNLLVMNSSDGDKTTGRPPKAR